MTTDYEGAGGLNFFEEDRLVRGIAAARLPRESRDAALGRLSALGAVCGGKLNGLIEFAHRDGRWPELKRYDRWGARIDEIVYCPEQRAARRLALLAGPLPPTPLLERMTMAYLLNQNGEGGVTCPLAMTDGLVQLLESRGAPEQKARWLPLLHDPDGPTPLTGGQFVTEKQGGSNVSENETRAVRASDGGWRLTGLKWFCSNPGELWVTTAKPEGSDAVALFLVPRRLPDGTLNECHTLRLKDLSGTRGKATAEVEYRGAHAELIGRPSQGLSLLLSTVLKVSRIHVAGAGLGIMRRASVEAGLYARSRVVTGRAAAEIPAVAASLSAIESSLAPATLAFFEELALLEAGDPAAEVLVPLLKIGVSSAATAAVREARLIFAGNGTLRDFSILPRLAEDALIQEIWEGTHPILAGHALKALRRPAGGAAFSRLLDSCGEEGPKPARERLLDLRRNLDARIAALRAAPKKEAADAVDLCLTAYRTLGLALLLKYSGGPLDADGILSRAAARVT